MHSLWVVKPGESGACHTGSPIHERFLIHVKVLDLGSVRKLHFPELNLWRIGDNDCALGGQGHVGSVSSLLDRIALRFFPRDRYRVQLGGLPVRSSCPPQLFIIVPFAAIVSVLVLAIILALRFSGFRPVFTPTDA